MGFTEEDDETIRRLAREGFSASQIGTYLKPIRTRNSIIGRAHRKGIPLNEANGNAHMKKPGTKNSRQIIARRARRAAALAGGIIRRERCVLPVVVPKKVVDEDYSHCTHLLDLTIFSCRWPMWPHAEHSNQMFCGGTKVSSESYCPYHKKVAEPNGRD